MLEQMRQQSQSLIIYVLFGIIIAVFIISFGPQRLGGFKLPEANATWAAQVDSNDVSFGDYRWAYQMAGAGNVPVAQAKALRLREQTLDKMIERELFAAEAERLGLRVSQEEVEDFIAQSKISLFGNVQVVSTVQKNGKFDYDLWKRFVQYSGLSQKNFIEQMRRELLAARVRNVIKEGVTVSDADIKDKFVRDGTQVNLEYLRLPLRRYEDAITPTAQEIAAYAAAHEAKLKELYTQRKFLYEKVPRELKLRAILVKLDGGASADAQATAQKKADGLVARIKKGEAFAAVAQAASDDTATKGRGGALGWKRQGATTMGAAVEEKAWAGKEGDIVGPLKGNDGFYVLSIEGARQGDLAFEAVRADIAENELRSEQVKAKAQADANAALAKAKAASDKSFKDLFPAASDKDKDAKTDAAKKPNAVTAKAEGEAPEAQETGLFSRRGNVVEGIGVSPELAKVAFGLTKDAPFAGPVEVSGALVVVKLKEHKDADLADFEKRKAELVSDATDYKGRKVAEEWAQRRCVEEKGKKRIRVNPEAVRYEDGSDAVAPYEPCVSHSSPFGL